MLTFCPTSMYISRCSADEQNEDMAFKAITSSTCLLFFLFGTCESSAMAAQSGTVFVFAPMPNHPDVTGHASIGLILQATTDERTTVQISFPGISVNIITLSHDSGPYKYSLPRFLVRQTTSGLVDSTVFVSSDQAFTCLHYNLDQSNSDTFTLVPSHSLGTEYFVATITWQSNPTEGAGIVSISTLGERTSIEIHLTSTVQFHGETFHSGDVISYTLLPFQSIQLLPENTDITGTRILSNASISVSAGAKCANVPENVQFCDHLAEQLAPFKAWGRIYLLSPFLGRGSGYVFQVVVGRDQTTITYNNSIETRSIVRNMGEFVMINVPSQIMTFISADKPILVMQYPKGRRADNIQDSDPSMIRVTPIEQFVSEAIFPVYEFPSATTNVDTIHLELTAECRYIRNIPISKNHRQLEVTWNENYTSYILDEIKMCAQWTTITGGSYTLRSQSVLNTEGQIIYPRFRAVVYGTGSGETYLYRAGAMDRPLTCNDAASMGESDHEHDCQILVDPEIVSVMATQFTITWSSVPGTTGIFDGCTVSITSAGGITRALAIAGHPPTRTLQGLQPYSDYSLSMNCSNRMGIRSRLEFPVQTTLKDEPHPPNNVMVTEVTQRSALVSWEPPLVSNGGDEVSGYVVFAVLQNCLASACTTPLKEYTTDELNQNLELDPFSTYIVAVMAFNIESRIPSPGDMLNSSQAISEAFTTLKAEPGPPSNVTIRDVTEASVIVSWTEPTYSNGPIDGFVVYAIPIGCLSISCSSDQIDVSTDDLEHTLSLRAYTTYRAVVIAYTVESRLPGRTKLNSSLTYSEPFRTFQTAPMKPMAPSKISRGVTYYSFDIRIPDYQNPNGPISCFEVIVVQFYDASTSIDSDDNAYSINNTRDYSIAKSRIGTPIRALVFSSIPVDNVITVGSRDEVHSECNTFMTLDDTNEGLRGRRDTVKASTIGAINGPLNEDSFYSCFIRVYSPSHQNGEVYFSNGAFMKPIRLAVPGSGIFQTVTIVCVSVILLSIIVIITCIAIHICRRKRSHRHKDRGLPTTPSGVTMSYRRCADNLADNPLTSPRSPQISHDYEQFESKTNPVYQTIEENYDFVIHKSYHKGSP